MDERFGNPCFYINIAATYGEFEHIAAFLNDFAGNLYLLSTFSLFSRLQMHIYSPSRQISPIIPVQFCTFCRISLFTPETS